MKGRIIAIIAIVITFCGGMALLINRDPGTNPADTIYAPAATNGNIPEKTLGDPDKAELVVYEYADYGCSHCAKWNSIVGDLVEAYDGRLAVVFRAFDLGYKNGPAASLAATAAQLQGYWKKYKDLLFANQLEWFYADEEELAEILVEYFEKASGGKGDAEKFAADIASANVAKRVEFEGRMGTHAGVTGTPTFRIDGEKVVVSNLVNTISEKLGE